MKFGPRPVATAEGAILAHSVRLPMSRLRKGRCLSAADIETLTAAGINTVTVAVPGPDDIGEDDAASALAAALTGPGISAAAAFTGRANLHAETAGLLRLDTTAIHAANSIDEAITIASLPDYARVQPRQMVATAKIIPYAVPVENLNRATAVTRPMSVLPFRRLSVALILTRTPGFADKLLDKARTAVTARLASLGLDPPEVRVVPHETAAVAATLHDSDAALVLLFGASATSDRADVCPAGLALAGGDITRFGMPVDPGNLLFLGRHRDRPVIGLPGCARSPALNGADWVLERVVAGVDVTSADIGAMGVGGLLKEIPTRPQPRGGNPQVPSRPKVEILLLAGGRSRRMKGADKLLREADGIPLLRKSAAAAQASMADQVRVVIPAGHQDRRAALADLDVSVIEAADTTGMASSLRAGMAARDGDTDAVMVALADMPDITAGDYDRLIAAFDPSEGRSIIRATTAIGSAGNPVLFGRRFFEALEALTGDTGAKSVIAAAQDYVVDVALPGDAARVDLDTPEAWSTWEARKR